MTLKEQCKRYKIKVIGTGKVKLDDLHIQYVPMVKPEQWWHGLDMMALRTSPHVELLEIIKEHGFDWAIIKQSGYWKERVDRRETHGRKDWTNEYIKRHIKRRWETYRSLKKKGYKKDLSTKQPLLVLKEPLWNTRFNWNDPNIRGLELVDGAGRASSAYVLGWKTIPVTWVQDAAPGSCTCKPIEGKFKEVLKGKPK